MAVVLPSNLKYNQDIIEAIINALLKESKLSYTALYNNVKQKLGRTLSYRDFDKHIDKLNEEKRLDKSDSGKRGTKVFYSLTESAIKGYQLEVLGFNEKTTKQRILYQLIFLREIYGLDYRIYEQDLDFFLSNIPASRSDLVIDSEDRDDEMGTFTYYKLIMGVRIFRISLNESKYNKAETYYDIKLPGVSIRDVINPNLGRRISYPLPFDHVNFTEDEVKDGIGKLQSTKLVKPVIYINDEERYSLVYNEFRDMLERIYRIHTRKMGLIQHKWTYERRITEERKQMEFIYGKKKAHEIINNCYQTRSGSRKEIRENKKFIQQLKSDYKLQMREISDEIQKIKEEYSNTFSNYGFNQDFVEKLLFENII